MGSVKEKTYTKEEIEQALIFAREGVEYTARVLSYPERALVKSTLVSHESLFLTTLEGKR